MTSEHHEPAYAERPSMPQKDTKAEAVYHTEQITFPEEDREVDFFLEEDILVPDTMADMTALLFGEAQCESMPMEKQLSDKEDELVQLAGFLHVQLVYQPVGEEQLPVAISASLPYKYAWQLDDVRGKVCLSCEIRNLEYLMMNERKCRIRATLRGTARCYSEKYFSFFDRLKDEPLELRTEEKQLACLAMIKREEVAIDDQFPAEAAGQPAEKILTQHFAVVENYRQIAGEKIMINGFIHVQLLCQRCASGEKEADLWTFHHRLEFTQFMAMGKGMRGKSWQAAEVAFSSGNLRAELTCNAEGAPIFRIHGGLETSAAIYEKKSQTMVIDAYHRQKAFRCRFVTQAVRNLQAVVSHEIQLKDLLPAPKGATVSSAVSCSCRILDCHGTVDQGVYQVDGLLQVITLWKDADGTYRTERTKVPYQSAFTLPEAATSMQVVCRPQLKTCSVTMLHENRAEFHGVLWLGCSIFIEDALVLLEEPALEAVRGERHAAMIITTVEQGETLWDLAKRYQSTEAEIQAVNHLEGPLTAGQRLLLVK